MKTKLIVSLLAAFALSVFADDDEYFPFTLHPGASFTIMDGVPLQGTWVFASGSTINVTDATKIGFPSGGGTGVPPGGSTGDVLAKIDTTDYNTHWVSLGSLSGPTPTPTPTPTATPNIISIAAYSSAWDGVIDRAPALNSIYDQLHKYDSDDNDKIDVLDGGAGFVNVNSSGQVQTGIAGQGTGNVVRQNNTTLLGQTNYVHIENTQAIGALTNDHGTWTTETVVGSDAAGILNLTPSATGPTNTTICSIAFGTPYSAAPQVFLVAVSQTACLAQGSTKALNITSITASGFDVSSGPVGLASGAVYQFGYIIVK